VIRAVKLEIGGVSTLGNDAPMDYGRELAVCQRYQVVSGPGHMIRATAVTSEVITFVMPVTTTMRIRPVISNNGNIFIRRLNDTAVSGFTASVALHGSNWVRIIATHAGHLLTDAYALIGEGVVFDANL
jgi:hypothetical protein